MTKTLYRYEVAIIYNDEETGTDLFSGYMATYKDALEIAFKFADAIAPRKTIISILKKELDNDKDTN